MNTKTLITFSLVASLVASAAQAKAPEEKLPAQDMVSFAAMMLQSGRTVEDNQHEQQVIECDMN